ncbi:MAG TPA: DUF1543 domain-containing protein [Coxiellaceae bacterium]|nr:MAG: hypothetical protein A3E81_03735 [Gammaproteobacteria bacterium RIFCSPHIGHO2_12_FULL_36_30]HLB56133.1 DUF1543 domain-containing protein [Coxiellaceae bacterium]
MRVFILHNNFLVVANDVKDAKEKMTSKKIFQDKKMHIDGIIEIKYVDGYDIQLSPNKIVCENKIYSGADLRNMM